MQSIELRLLTAFSLLVALSLSACGGDDEPTKPPPPTPAAAAAIEESAAGDDADSDDASEDATREAEAAALAAATATEAPPSPTPAPSRTAGPSPTPWPSLTPGPLPAGLPTIDPASWPTSHLSPDGRWWVRGGQSEELGVKGGSVMTGPDISDADEYWYHRGQQIISTDGTVVHEIQDEWSTAGLGSPSPAVLGWTPDSRWLYVYQTGHGDGCSIYSGASDLIRFSPETGESQYLLAWLGSEPALSADGSTLAYVSYDNLVLLRPDDGNYLEALIPGHEDASMQAGEPRFAADGTVEFFVDYAPCGADWTRAQARFEPATGRIELLGTPAPRN